MKIKTVWTESNITFDTRVNELLRDGWILGKREVFPAKDLNDSVFYAELVQLDPEPVETTEPQPVDPVEALHVIRDTCEAIPVEDCSSNGCPLYAWCEGLRKGGDPTDWVIPGEVLA